MRPRALLSGLALATLAACVPADGAIALGSVSFTVTASRPANSGFSTTDFEVWTISFERVVLAFRTMTIGKVGDPDRCSYRGRGERSDIVFDPRFGIVQTFNGIAPANCEDVGVFLDPPGDNTEVGPGATSKELVELAAGAPAHAVIDAAATTSTDFTGTTTSTTRQRYEVRLRFETATTSSRFGGCQGRGEPKGIRIQANERLEFGVAFGPENLFRDSLGFNGAFRFDPFVEADRLGDDDGIVTMAELDKLPLTHLRGFGDAYELADGTRTGSFGDYIRYAFRFTFYFKDVGTCVGNAPGSE